MIEKNIGIEKDDVMGTNCNYGVFYSVGVGPGDPSLMTIKSVETIKKSDIIVLPKSGAAENIAFKIAKQYLVEKTIIECDMPMTRDKELLHQSHEAAAQTIENLLKDGKTVSFLTLGDPSIYSSAMYVHKKLTERGYKTILIPGIPSFCAVAASLNTSLCEGGELLHIIPASYEDIDESLALKGNKILMKSGKSIYSVRDKILNSNNKEAMIVECASMENEKVYKNIELMEENASYFSILLVKEGK